MPPNPDDIVLANHQRVASEFMTRNPRCALYLDVGYGKTLTTLYTLNKIKPNGNILVIGPLNVMKATWADEIDKWGFKVRHRSLILNERGKKLTRAKRLEMYSKINDAEPAMYFLNQNLVTDIVEYFSAPGRAWPFLVVIVDEAQDFADETTKKFKALAKVAHKSPVFIELTGTPAADSLMELWSQNFLLDGGEALGTRISQYQERWFTPDLIINNHVAKWRPQHPVNTRKEIFDAIKHHAISVENTDLKLPEVTHNQVLVHLDPEVMEDYRTFAKDAVLALAREGGADGGEDLADELERDAGPVVEGVNAAVLHNKLMQYASGTVYVDPTECSACGQPIVMDFVERTDEKGDLVIDPEYGEPFLDPAWRHEGDADHDVKLPPKESSYHRVHTAKVDELEHIVRQTGSPVLVAYKYRAEVREITELLTERGLPTPRVFDGSRAMTREWNDRSIPIMLIHPASAGAGLNLQEGGHTLVWYTPTASNKQFTQTCGRIARPGQKNPVMIHMLLAAGTLDTRIPDILEGKDSMQSALKEHVKVSMATDRRIVLASARS